jgi:hypothetical protein
LPITSTPSSPTASYEITLLLGIIPRIGTYQFAGTATLEEVEVAVKMRFDLRDQELEFGLLDLQSNETAIIPKSMLIGQLDLEKFSLIARPSETFERHANAASVKAGGDQSVSANDADEGPLLQSVHITVGSAPPSSKVYNFFCDSLQQNLHIRFPYGATMKQAKDAIAHHYKKPPEAILLDFLGKELRDGFVMDKLRLGTTKINVYFRNDSEILLPKVSHNV